MIKKLIDREKKAKYIFGKFGIQLLTSDRMTKKELIPVMGEHIRNANDQVFEHNKMLLKSRKDSSNRFHY